jgi:hypothetical protein
MGEVKRWRRDDDHVGILLHALNYPKVIEFPIQQVEKMGIVPN